MLDNDAGVAMSLCTLIYCKIRRITSVDHMIQIMIVGNQLYSGLSPLARQSMLMLTELPGMVTVFQRFFQLEYSGSYTCNIHGDARIEGYRYCICYWVQHLKHSRLWTTTHSFQWWESLVLVSTALRVGDIKYLILMLEICMVTVTVKGHAYCWKYHPCINKSNIFRLYIGMRIYISLKVCILPSLKLIFFQAVFNIVVPYLFE